MYLPEQRISITSRVDEYVGEGVTGAEINHEIQIPRINKQDGSLRNGEKGRLSLRRERIKSERWLEVIPHGDRLEGIFLGSMTPHITGVWERRMVSCRFQTKNAYSGEGGHSVWEAGQQF
ncbi:MAG: hypothetical protein ACYC9S_04970 [Leptospirales bacterium]